MASSQNVELEAANFLHKLIQNSKDEPAKLATKLHVILQHMKSSGKEHSMPYQVISRAMETVINQHGLSLSGGVQIGSSSQAVGGAKDSRRSLSENESSKLDPFPSGRPPVGPSSGAPDYYQGSVVQRSDQSFDQGSPSSLDSRSANSHSQDRRDAANWDKNLNQKDGKKATTKRKRGDTSSPLEPHVDSPSQIDPRNSVLNTRKAKLTKAEPLDDLPVKSGAYAKVQGGMAAPTGASSMVKPILSSSMQYGSVSALDDMGSSSSLTDEHKMAQIGRQSSGMETMMLRQEVPSRDTGKSAITVARSFAPFEEQQLKQLRAQCLVYLAFRNCMVPKKLHLEMALGTTSSREGNTSGVTTQVGGRNNLRQPDTTPSGSSSAAKVQEANSLPKGTESPRTMEDKVMPHSDIHMLSDERKHLSATKRGEVDRRIQERAAAQGSLATPSQQLESSSTTVAGVVNSHLDDDVNRNVQVGRSNQPPVVGLNSWTGFAGQNEASKGLPQIPTGLPIDRRDIIAKHWKHVSGTDSDLHGTMMKDGNVITKHVSPDMFKTLAVDNASKHGINFTTEQEGNERQASSNLQSPKYSMSDRWIMDQQKKRHLVERSFVQKQQKAKQRMATSFLKLKENVNSSEDISAKTKSVIELKKLQLLDLQRRLRSNFLNDFFKPIAIELEYLKSFKKHRHGRRVKQLERYEQKMKEERQKRIRERQKEFFGEIEVHKEKLDDVFKIKRERWKGFNRYVKEFHKRKERTHREKIDRIQREKINLLKINDVEGYLRMVKDAKSDRVKQLLKETEKYLQKLGSKLQEAKSAAGRFGQDDEAGSYSFPENGQTNSENEDLSDQAKHYMESNEKYYMMAHSIKESIAEQPSCLQGGKLREYQMNGLRWLVSLYNNHLNGILADEMGLGKTVQVISLICYLMETKNDRGPFLVVVPSSVLPGWDSEISFWAPVIHKIVYAGPPEERRRLFKERIVHQKFNVLLTTYEYLMNKHDRPKLSKIHWHYVIIDEGHRIKNASCKLNAELKHYHSSHRLLLTGTPLQNNLEELWALLNFLLPNVFNSSEDFSQWFNKPFESNGDNSPDEALLSEEENLLIINRLHQVLRPFVLRRLKHKVENELPEKIERLIRCEASAYQKLLMKRVEENLGSIGTTKARSVHNSVMELRNICNHPYLSQLHAEEVDNFMPKHYLPPIIRLCGKLETLDRLLPKLKAADHRVLFFSTMTRLLDVMEEYLSLKQYRYLRLDGHTTGSDRGALIDLFNRADSPYFIFLLSIRAGGVGVNLQAADTVILFDTDWNPQVDLQAQARAHRIGQKRDVLVLRFETVQTVEEQVRASAEHKLGVANQSITAGFFDNNTSAEDRREYLESLLRECKKEEAAPVLDDDALNDILVRSEAELDVFEAVDKKRKDDELAAWKKLVVGQATGGSDLIPPLPSRLVTDEDLKQFFEAMKISDVSKGEVESNGVKRKSGNVGGLDIQHYGRGKRAREERSYKEQWTEEEFEKMCQVESPSSLKVKEVAGISFPANVASSVVTTSNTQPTATVSAAPIPMLPSVESLPVQQIKEVIPPAKRGRGRPKRIASDKPPAVVVPQATFTTIEIEKQLPKGTELEQITSSVPHSAEVGAVMQSDTIVAHNAQPVIPINAVPPNSQPVAAAVSVQLQAGGQGRKPHGAEGTRRRGKKQAMVSPPITGGPDLKISEQFQNQHGSPPLDKIISPSDAASNNDAAHHPTTISAAANLNSGNDHLGAEIVLNAKQPPPLCTLVETDETHPSVQMEQGKVKNCKSQTGAGAPRRRGKKQATISPPIPNVPDHQDSNSNPNLQILSSSISGGKATEQKGLLDKNIKDSKCVILDQPSQILGEQDLKPREQSDDSSKQTVLLSSSEHGTIKSPGSDLEKVNNPDVCDSYVEKVKSSEINSSKIEVSENSGSGVLLTTTPTVVIEDQHLGDRTHQVAEISKSVSSIVGTSTTSLAANATRESITDALDPLTAKAVPSTPLSIVQASDSTHSPSLESMPAKRQPRKAQNRAEAPRRSGRKSASMLPAVPVAPSDQDPNLIHDAQNSSRDSLVGKAANATQAQALEILLPSGVPVHDSKRKERATNSTASKQQKVASTRIDSAAVSSDKITAFGRNQNVNDFARVMKEVFSGTCLPKPKAQDSVGSEDKSTTFVHVTTKAAIASNNQSLEDKACCEIPTTGAACSTSDVSVHLREKHSEVSNVQDLECGASLDMPTTGVMNLMQGTLPNGDEQISASTYDNKITTVENKRYFSPPETSGCDDVKAKDEQAQVYVQNLSIQGKMEVPDAIPVITSPKTGSSEKLPTGDGLVDSGIGDFTHQLSISKISPSGKLHLVIDHNLGDQSKPSIEKSSSSLNICGTGHETAAMKPEHSSTSTESTQANTYSQGVSPTEGPPGFTEHTLDTKLDLTEISQKPSPRDCEHAEMLGDQQQETPSSTAITPLSMEMVVSSVPRDPENFGSESKSSLHASVEVSFDDGTGGDEVSASADHDRNSIPKPPKFSLDPVSASVSEMACSVSPKADKAEQYQDALKFSDLREASLLESCPESLCKGKRDEGNSICKELSFAVKQHISSVPQENMVPSPVGSSKDDLSQIHSMIDASNNDSIKHLVEEKPVCQSDTDKVLLQRPSSSEDEVNNLAGVSGVSSLVEATVSETSVLPCSTLVNKQNGNSSATSLVWSSESFEESMEKGVAGNSGIQEEADVNMVETNVPLESEDLHVKGVKGDVLPDTVDLPTCLMTKESNIEGSSARGLSVSSSSSDEFNDSKVELGDKDVSQAGGSLTTSGDNISKIKEEGINCSSDKDGSQGQSVSPMIPVCSDDSCEKLDVPQVDPKRTISGTVLACLSQVKEEKVGVPCDTELVARSTPECDMEGSKADQSNTVLQVNKLPSKSPETVDQSVEGELPLVNGESAVIGSSNQIDACQVSQEDSEKLTSQNMVVPSSCSLMEQDNVDVSSDKGPLCSPLALGEPRDPLIVEDSHRDGTNGSEANPSPQQEQEYPEAEIGDHRTTDFDGVDPELLSKNMELLSSLGMEQDKVDVLSYPLATTEPKDCLTQEDCDDSNEASNPSVAQIDHQVEASDDVAGDGDNAERLPLKNINIPSESLMIEEMKVDGSSVKVSLCSLPAPGDPKVCLTGGRSCSKVIEVPTTKEIMVQESFDSGAEMDNQSESQVDGIPVDDEARCLAVSVTTAEGKNEVEVLPDEGPQRIFKVQDNVSRELTDEDEADKSQVPVSSASVVNVEDLVDGTGRMQVTEESEAVVSDDGMDATLRFSAVQETASIDVFCTSAALSEHVESLSKKGFVVPPIVNPDIKESEAGVINQGNKIAQDNELKDVEHVESFSEKDIVAKSSPNLDAKESNNLETQAGQDDALKDTESVESFSEKDVVGNSSTNCDAKESEASVTNQGNDIMQDDELKDRESEAPVTNQGNDIVHNDKLKDVKHLESLPDKDSFGNLPANLDSKDFEGAVTNQGDQIMQDDRLKDVKPTETSPEKDLVGNNPANLDIKEFEGAVTSQGDQIVYNDELRDVEHVVSLLDKDSAGNSSAILNIKQPEDAFTKQRDEIMQDVNHGESFPEKDLVGNSTATIDPKESEGAVTNQGDQIMQDDESKEVSEKWLVGNSTANIDPKESGAVTNQGDQLMQGEESKDILRVESLPEKDIVGSSPAAKESEADVTEAMHEDALKHLETPPSPKTEERITESSCEKDTTTCSETQQESKVGETEDGSNIVQNSDTQNEKAPENESVENSVVEADDTNAMK
nr:chromatin structure-remodeling complex protein SYD isoform X5 [Arachis hypogaea]